MERARHGGVYSGGPAREVFFQRSWWACVGEEGAVKQACERKFAKEGLAGALRRARSVISGYKSRRAGSVASSMNVRSSWPRIVEEYMSHQSPAGGCCGQGSKGIGLSSDMGPVAVSGIAMARRGTKATILAGREAAGIVSGANGSDDTGTAETRWLNNSAPAGKSFNIIIR